MNKRENNRMRMYSVVDAVLSRHEDAIANNEAMAKVVGKFRGSLDVVRERSREHHTATVGVTDAKNSAGEELIDRTLRIADALYIFGRDTNSEPIKATCRLKRSNLNSMSDSELQACGAKIAELAQNNAAAIVPFGITAEEIAAYTASIEAFEKQLAEHYHRHAESKAAREMLFSAFDATNEILKEELDVMIDMIKESDKEFYEEYQAARVIKDLGVHSTKTETQPETEPVTEAVS